FCAKVIEGGGDYVLPVKENQPTLGKDIVAAFAEPEAGLSPLQAARREAEVDRACEIDKGHGRIEKRSIEVTSSMAEYLGADWPGCAQVFRLTRERKTGEKVETEVVRGIASLPRERAGARGTAAPDPRPLGDRERPARRAGRDAPRGRQPDQERFGDAGDGHREEHRHRHLHLQPAGLQERRGRRASLRLPPPRDTGNPVKTNLRMKRPWAASLLRLTVCRQTSRVSAKPSQNLRQTTARNHGLGRRHVMIAQECGRRTLGWLLGISIAGILATGPAQAQQQRRSLFGGTQTAAPKADDNPAADTPQSIRLDQINVPGVKVTAIPVNPTD